MLHGSTPARMRGAAGMMLASAALLTLPHLFVATANAAALRPAEGDAYWAIVTGSSVNLRSGPSAQSAYAFGKLKQGDVVRVAKEEYGWARIVADGSAFSDVVVFVPADRRVTASDDGKSVTVNARTELRAPNVDAGGSPDKSWKQVGSVDAGTSLACLGVANGSKEDVYRVKAPASTEAWVNLQFLRRATDAEAAAAPSSADQASATGVASTATPTVPAATGVEAPVNAPESGAPATATAAADLGVQPLSSPSIPPLLGEQPRNASAEPAAGASPAKAPAAPPQVTARATLDDLEHQFKAVRTQAQADAEFEALGAKYEQLAASTEAAGGIKGLAEARAKQLTLMAEIQRQVQEAQRAKASAEENRKGISELVLNIQRRADYTAVGILNASAVYDGQRLPELYRVCDALTGATIAYVEPNPDLPLATMVGTLVGVKGGKSVDPALRLTVISPMAVEILTQREAPQVVKTEATRPIEAAGTFAPAEPAATEAVHPDAAPCPDNPAPDLFELVPGATP